MSGKERKADITRLMMTAVIILVTAVFALCGCDDLEIVRERSSTSGESRKVLIEDVPDYSGSPYVVINGDVPEFTKGEIKRAKKAVRKGRRYEILTELDGLGRCGSAEAVVSGETMPDGERGSIGMIRPSGWQLDKYDFIDNGGYLYNRCHLIGWQLTGLNDEERNLITGTRYMNVDGMLPFENMVADHVRCPGSDPSGNKTSSVSVLYRATPVFRGKELVARGVQLEAYSLDDDGAGLAFNVYCYNVQPGVIIDYKNGENRLDESEMPQKEDSEDDSGKEEQEDSNAAENGDGYPPPDIPEGVTYILNTNTMRFHDPDCKGAATIREHNREWFYGTRDEAIEAGYVPCGMCKP